MFWAIAQHVFRIDKSLQPENSSQHIRGHQDQRRNAFLAQSVGSSALPHQILAGMKNARSLDLAFPH